MPTDRLTMGKDVTAVINYFSRDPKFQREKPYVTSFPVDDIEGASVSNHENEPVPVNMSDIRGLPPPSLDREGFTILESPTSLTYDDFANRELVRSQYFAELREMLKKAFPHYRTLVFFDHEIRRRSPMYPKSVGATVEHAQPLAQTHVDYSPGGARCRLERVLQGPEMVHLLSRKCELLNVWRPIVAQTDDWPLALCDWQSVKPADDILSNDVVYENSVGEDQLLMSSKSHRWWYLSDHRMDEVFVWRNTNIPDGDKPRAFHTAFENPLANPENPRRESIEVRLAAFL
ncbi:hypothetical protein QBC44DRAFT_337448 [Cladorrhinum sp. PSN332]|nr:hypothetical protein QBC44DRAFT_337448 [Cladorrhinum sp. PSN332]